MDFKDRLGAMKESYQDSQKSYDIMFGGAKVDAGEYVVRLLSATIVESKSSGKLQIKREHVILEGEFTGITIYDYMGIEHSSGFTFVIRWFEQMGYVPPEEPDEIPEVLDAINSDACTAKILVKHSGDFVNVSVIEVLNEETQKEPVKQKEEPKEEPKRRTRGKKEPDLGSGPDDFALINDLFAFCKSEKVKTEKDDTLDVLCERIREYDWQQQDMTKDEIQMFQDAGIENVIVVPKKKPSRQKRS